MGISYTSAVLLHLNNLFTFSPIIPSLVFVKIIYYEFSTEIFVKKLSKLNKLGVKNSVYSICKSFSLALLFLLCGLKASATS